MFNINAHEDLALLLVLENMPIIISEDNQN